MRSLSLTALAAVLSLAAGSTAPAFASPRLQPSEAPATVASSEHSVRAVREVRGHKAGSGWASPLAETDRFDYWFDLCANAAPTEALEACQRATELEPEFAVAWDNLGAVLEQLGQYDDALLALDRALVLTPDDSNIWYNVGVVLAKMQQYSASAEAFEHAYHLNPEDDMARKFAELLRDRFSE